MGAAKRGRTTPKAGPRPLRPDRRSVGMAPRSAGTGAQTLRASPTGAPPAAPSRSGPAPARPPWRPWAATALTTDVLRRRRRAPSELAQGLQHVLGDVLQLLTAVGLGPAQEDLRVRRQAGGHHDLHRDGGAP